MDTSMNAAAQPQTAEARQAAQALSKWWWGWLVSGILWILASIVILQFRQSSITLVGIVIGIMFLVAGIEELTVAFVSGGWRWLWAVFGVILLIGGIYALFNPVQTFLAVADLLGFLFALVGIFWIIEAFATMANNSLWWLGDHHGPARLLGRRAVPRHAGLYAAYLCGSLGAAPWHHRHHQGVRDQTDGRYGGRVGADRSHRLREENTGL